MSAADAARWTTALLVVALGVTLARTTWLVVPIAPGPTAPPPPLATGTANETPRLTAVAARHLFGEAVQPAAAPGAGANAPDTTLNLTLHGLFAAKRKETAFAIIAQPNGDEQPYRIGDAVPGGAKVQDILDDRVVLDRNGRLETLRMVRDRIDTGTDEDAGTAAGTTLPGEMADQARELRSTLTHKPQEIFNLAQLTPVMKNGELQGYRVRPKQYKELFQAAGLEPGDVIVAVNGVSVTDPQQLTGLTQQLGTATSLTLTVERRGGVRTDVSVNMQ